MSWSKKRYREAVSKLSAVRIPSGRYPAILRYDVATDLLGSLWSMFSSEQIQKDLSVLKDRQGQAVMSPLITIVDDPQLPDGFVSCDFDDEGVPTQRTVLVEKGVFKEALYDRKSARKRTEPRLAMDLKMAAVGSDFTDEFACRAGRSIPGHMMAQIEEGVLITDLQGLHAG
ncbi:MAG: metallopeptidase TldD-related protein [Holdemania massiliensis]